MYQKQFITTFLRRSTPWVIGIPEYLNQLKTQSNSAFYLPIETMKLLHL